MKSDSGNKILNRLPKPEILEEIQALSISELDILIKHSKRLREEYYEAYEDKNGEGEPDYAESTGKYLKITNAYSLINSFLVAEIERRLMHMSNKIQEAGYDEGQAYNPYFNMDDTFKVSE